MKQDNTCSKCGQRDLIRVPPLPTDEPHFAVGERGMRPVQVTRHVCAACGFVEEWVDNMDDLKKLKEQYGEPR
jgi:ribosomal protein L37E